MLHPLKKKVKYISYPAPIRGEDEASDGLAL